MSVRIDFLEGLNIALNSLRNYRLRTVLTTLGVGIGVATLLAILGVVQGMDRSFQTQLDSLGNASLYVSRWPWVSMGDWWLYRNRPPLTQSDVQKIRSQCTKCAAAVPILDDTSDVAYMGRKLTSVEIVGSTQDWPEVSTYEVVRGRFITYADDVNYGRVTVLGSDLADTLFPATEPLGQTVRISGKPYTVVGIFGSKGQILDNNQDLMAFIPFNSFKAYLRRQRSIDIGIKVADPKLLDDAESELTGILRRIRQTPPDKPDDFSINKPDQLAATYKSLTGALYGVALGIGLITLLVGGIGIMNIMLVSVKERTREIGVRRALGARKRTIITQFIIEAILVSALGGILGTIVGLGGAWVVSQISPLAATVQPSTVAFGILFAATVGLVFGIWPAARAASLDPVEALRDE